MLGRLGLLPTGCLGLRKRIIQGYLCMACNFSVGPHLHQSCVYNSSRMGCQQSQSPVPEDTKVEKILRFEFHGKLIQENPTNGLCFNGIFLPEEVVEVILSHVSVKHILHATLVCKTWCNIIKSSHFWSRIYKRQGGKTTRNLPWYIFYCHFATELLDRNLLKNCTRIKHHSPGWFTKFQYIDLTTNNLLLYIVNKHKPHIYVSGLVCYQSDIVFMFMLHKRKIRYGYKKDLQKSKVVGQWSKVVNGCVLRFP